MDRLCACCVQSSRLCTAHSRLWQMASLVTTIQVPSVAPQVTLGWYPTMECPVNLQSRDTKKAVPPPGREEGILENCRGFFWWSQWLAGSASFSGWASRMPDIKKCIGWSHKIKNYFASHITFRCPIKYYPCWWETYLEWFESRIYLCFTFKPKAFRYDFNIFWIFQAYNHWVNWRKYLAKSCLPVQNITSLLSEMAKVSKMPT